MSFAQNDFLTFTCRDPKTAPDTPALEATLSPALNPLSLTESLICVYVSCCKALGKYHP